MNENKVFYHGTDARVLAMSKEERSRFKDMCKYIGEFGYHTFATALNDESLMASYKKILEKDFHVFHNSLNTALMAYGTSSSEYQYNDTYLATWPCEVVIYARDSFAFGEIGLIAFGMAIGLMQILGDEKLPDDVWDDCCEIFNFGTEDAKPVVVQLSGLDLENIRDEFNRRIDWNNQIPEKMGIYSFRYKGELSLENFKVLSADEYINTLTPEKDHKFLTKVLNHNKRI